MTRQEAPDAGRVYDALLRVKHNADGQPVLDGGYSLPADRAAALALIALEPGLPERMQLRRRFVAEAVQRAVKAGIARVIDVGAGYPADPPLHADAGGAQVVYLSADLAAMAAVRAEFDGDQLVKAIKANPADPEVAASFADGTPVAVILRGLYLRCPAAAAALVKTWTEPMPPGSRLITYAPHYTDPDLSVSAGNVNKATVFWNYSQSDLEWMLSGMELEWPGASAAEAWLRGMPWTPDLPVYDLAVTAITRR